MPPESLTLAQLTTVAGIGVATALIDKLIWTTTAATPQAISRFGPILALGTGIVVGGVAAFVLGIVGQDFAQVLINGAVGGLSGIGLYDVFTSKAGLG